MKLQSSIPFMLVLILAIVSTPAATAETVEGLWDASIAVHTATIPFQIEIAGNGDQVSAYFFNGEERVNPSSSGSFHGDSLLLNFDSYATQLQATLRDGVLTGTYGAGAEDGYAFQAIRHKDLPQPPAGQNIPNIDGLWEIQVNSPKGEAAWHFIVNQSGAKVSASILRVDGDTGVLSGRYQEGKFVLAHFTGERPYSLEVTPSPDGSLQIVIANYRENQSLIAWRPDTARAKGLAPPTDPTQHTKLKNSQEPLHFRFPDLQGKIVSDTDSRFRGKVVLVNITGSWCPNCHDEAPFLQELYRKFHSQGLEIVALDFEPAEQLQSLSRLRAFLQRYGITYTYLIAGEPSQLQEKLPQAENLNAWPTTFFVGRDGLVRSVHTGFTSRASGGFDLRLKEEITGKIAQLLSENINAEKSAK